MNRKIVIKSCDDCPHHDHKGAFGVIAYIPICQKKGKELPYTLKENNGRAYAESTGKIPGWCPLPKN